MQYGLSIFPIVLVGMMGSGKTTVARHLAKNLACDFIDLDKEICRVAGKSIRTLFDEAGETHFRDLEQEVLAALFQTYQDNRIIIDTGGGPVVRAKNRALLAEHATTICLCRTPQHLQKYPRTLARPPVNGDFARYQQLLQERMPLYRSVASMFILNDNSVEAARRIQRFLIARKS